MYCQRFLLLRSLFSSLFIIILISSHFKSLFEELTSHYIFNYSNFIKNLLNYNSNIFFKSSSHHESIVISNRFKEIIIVFHFSEIFLNNYYIDSNSYDNRFFLTFFKMSRLTFALCDTFSNIIDVIVERWFDKFDYKIKNYQNDEGRFPFKKYLNYLNMLLIKNVIK